MFLILLINHFFDYYSTNTVFLPQDKFMLKRSLLCLSLVLGLSACSSIQHKATFEKPTHLLFIDKEINSLPVQVQRDERLCDGDKADDQNCPIKFFIDDFKAGEFYIHNTTTYYLKPNEYTLTVKNCKENCVTNHTKIQIDEKLPLVTLVLSIDENGKPFIINKKS